MTRIADLYFDSRDRGEGRVWPFRPFARARARIAIAMVVVLVLINQGQVGITVRLSFFNRDWFNAIQEKNAAEFWRQLLFVFTPWAFVYVAIRDHRIRRAVDADHPLAPLADGALCRALARRAYALRHGARRRAAPTIPTSASPRTSIASSTAATKATASTPIRSC